jgi:hypothetical protein
MMQTALASWTNFRHTTVLVNELVGAECGGPDWEPFEILTEEPLRGAVDPLPAAWRQLGAVLDLLAAHSRTALPELDIAGLLDACAKQARDFGGLAERQLRGEPLTESEYQTIQRYSGEIEHPYIQLKATVSRRSDGTEYGLAQPDPMTKIVDIAHDREQIWHMAVGSPIAVTVLLGDRGLLVPARGAIYSYYEVLAGTHLDDDKWRERMDAQARPEWAPIAR